jgi:hypothetical protein
MIICNPHKPQKYHRAETGVSPHRQKLDRRQGWFFFAIAPLAVLTGWSLVAVGLTGDWAWEWPSGLLLAVIGSTAAIIGNLFRFR